MINAKCCSCRYDQARVLQLNVYEILLQSLRLRSKNHSQQQLVMVISYCEECNHCFRFKYDKVLSLRVKLHLFIEQLQTFSMRK